MSTNGTGDPRERSKSIENKNLNNPGQKKSSTNINTNDKKNVPFNRRRKYYYKKKYKGGNKDNSSSTNSFSFKKVTVLIPLYNEEESLQPLYSEIKESVNKISCDHEILFMDDGSTDRSLSIIKGFARTDKKVHYISFRKNYGKSAALNLGFKKASGDAVITMDADLQDDPAEIPQLLKKLEEGYDLVSGWKKKRYDPLIKRQTSKFFNYITKVSSGIDIHDFNCGLKAYRKSVVKSVSVYGELHRYIPVLADWQGFRISEVPVKHHPRKYGKTKFGVSRFFKGFVDLITVLFTTRYIKRPLHLFGLLGAISFIAGFIVNGYLTYAKLVQNIPISNRPLLFLGMLLIIVGVQFFSIGLMGEIIVHSTRDNVSYSIKDKNL